MTARLVAFGVVVLLGLPAPVARAAGQATPVAMGSELLFSAAVPQEVLPAEAGPVYVARVSYEPGDGEDLVPDNGLTVLAVEAGAVTFTAGADAGGAATLVGAGRPEGGAAPPGSAVELAAGAAAVLPAGSGATVANEGRATATVVFVGLYPAEGFVPLTPTVAETPSGVVAWPLLGAGSPQAPPVASTLTIERVPVAPGAEPGTLDVRGVAVVHVEAGSVRAAVDAGLAEASSAAFLRTGAVGPGAALVGPGEGRRVRAEGSIFVHPGTALTLQNDGDEATTLLVVRLEPTGDAAGGTPTSS